VASGGLSLGCHLFAPFRATLAEVGSRPRSGVSSEAHQKGPSAPYQTGKTCLFNEKGTVETRPKGFERGADRVDKRELDLSLPPGLIMTIGSISAASLSQFVLSSGSSTPLQQALQNLQDSLTSGDLNGAQAAFQTVQQLNQSLENGSGSSTSSDSQLTTDMTALGNALSSGDLSTAQSAFATVQQDLQKVTAPSVTDEASAATQSEQLVGELLATVNSGSDSNSDATSSLLQQFYGGKSGLNVFA